MCYVASEKMNMLEDYWKVFTALFMCDVSECGLEAEEGWETVQRTNKTKSRPSPTGAPPSKTSVPARQADGDGRRTVSQMRCKEGHSQANIAVSRKTRSAPTDVKKQQCSVSAVDVTASSNSFPKSSSLNQPQQSKNSSHFNGSHGDRETKSSPRVMCPPVTAKSETCLKTGEIPAADASRQTESKLGEGNLTGSGDRRLDAGGADATEPQLHNTVCESQHVRMARGMMDVTVTDSRPSSSLTEVRRSESADIQRSSSNNDSQPVHICRKSVSDNTLMECMTVSGDDLIITICIHPSSAKEPMQKY